MGGCGSKTFAGERRVGNKTKEGGERERKERANERTKLSRKIVKFRAGIYKFCICISVNA